MSFDFMSFAGGFADVIVDKVKAEEAQAREDESWDRKFKKQQDAIDNRTRGDKRRAADEKAQLLAEKLGAIYTPEVAAEFMKNGVGYAEQYLEIGNNYVNNFKNPMSFINADVLAVPKLLPDGSNKAEVEAAALKFGSATGGLPSLVNREAMYSGLKEPDEVKIYTTFDDQYAAYSSQYTDLMNEDSPRYNPKKAQEFAVLRDAALKEIKKAAEADKDKTDSIYSDVSRTTIIRDFRRQALEAQKFTMGVEDNIDARIYGDEARFNVAEIASTYAIDNFNQMKDGSIQDRNLFNHAAFARANAENQLRTIASKTFNAGKAGQDPAAGDNQDKGLQKNFKVDQGNDGLYVALNDEQLQSKVQSGALDVGDVVIYFNEVTQSNQLVIYTGVGEDKFLGGAQLTTEQMRYN